MAFYRADIKAIARNIKTDASIAKALKEFMQEKVYVAAKLAQEDLIQEFDAHPVNIEIKNGVTKNSQFISGIGDLYSFIGFDAGADPVGNLRAVFAKPMRVGVKKYFPNGDIQFEILYPNPEAIIAASKMPWAEGLSWAEGIEEGIPGIASYISISGYGRSGGGVQITSETGKSFKTSPYLSHFYQVFAKSLNSINLRLI